MRIKLIGLIILVSFIALQGCVFFRHKNISASRAKNHQAILPLYSGLKARVAVADFDVRAAKATFEIGSELREMLIAAMVESKRFIISGRQSQAVENVNATQKDRVDPADLIISAIVTEFEPQGSGGRAGIGGGGGVDSGILGGLLGASLNKAHIGLEVRILDASNSEILANTQIQSQAVDVSGSVMTGASGNWALGGELATYAKTPMEKVIRVCIVEAVRYISQAVAQKYYKY